jgi:hypothetical protein
VGVGPPAGFRGNCHKSSVWTPPPPDGPPLSVKAPAWQWARSCEGSSGGVVRGVDRSIQGNPPGPPPPHEYRERH